MNISLVFRLVFMCSNCRQLRERRPAVQSSGVGEFVTRFGDFPVKFGDVFTTLSDFSHQIWCLF